jgi:hypothetical protein
MAPAIGVAVAVSFFVTLYYGYTRGGNQAENWFYERFPKAMETGYQKPLPEIGRTSMMTEQRMKTEYMRRGLRVQHILYGAGFMGFLVLMRHLFLWWPLHPIGFPFGSSHAVQQFWMAMMLGWAIKFFVLRYGGVKLFKQLRPFFLGLILGEFLSVGAWFFVDFIIGHGAVLYN